jgi:hypothetical protein
MVNAWVLPIAMLVLVYAFVGALLALFWVITRLAHRPARRYWQLPLRTWSILTTGFIMLAICVLIFTGAVYVSFLPAQTFSVMLTVLLVLGSMGVGLSCAVLILWLALVLRAQRRTPPLEVLFGRDRKKTKWAIVCITLCPIFVFGQMAQINFYHSWPFGILVAVPSTLYMLCVASLIAHSSEELLTSATQSSNI